MEKNRTLPDASARELGILAVMAVVILWMGIGSTFITGRTERASGLVIEQSQIPPRAYEVLAPAKSAPHIATAPADGATGAANSTPRNAIERVGTR